MSIFGFNEATLEKDIRKATDKVINELNLMESLLREAGKSDAFLQLFYREWDKGTPELARRTMEKHGEVLYREEGRMKSQRRKARHLLQHLNLLKRKLERATKTSPELVALSQLIKTLKAQFTECEKAYRKKYGVVKLLSQNSDFEAHRVKILYAIHYQMNLFIKLQETLRRTREEMIQISSAFQYARQQQLVIGDITVYYWTGIDQTEIQRLIETLRHAPAYTLVATKLSFTEPILVTLVPNRRDFSLAVEGNPDMAGYTSKKYGIFINCEVLRTWEGIRRLAAHELCHYVFLCSQIQLPCWLDEGLAEHYADGVAGIFTEDQEGIKERYREEMRHFKMRELWKTNPYSHGPDLVQLAYHHCKKLVEALIGGYGEERLFVLLRKLRGVPMDIFMNEFTEQFTAVYGKDPFAFEAEYFKMN